MLWEPVDVSTWELLEVEKTGQDERRWVRDPSTDHAWLFKPVIIKDGHRQGEDWSEVLASHIGHQLGVPCATIRLAKRDQLEGCISKDHKPREGWQIQPGSVLFTDIEPGYVSMAKGRPGHSLDNIRQVLTAVAAPLRFEPANFGAFDVFVGYLVFDAIIANRDRHDDNWSVLRPPRDGPDRLCGAYDQAGALGFNLTDPYREQCLRSGHVANWARKGTAHRFEQAPGQPTQTLVTLARQGLQMVQPHVAAHWLAAVDRLDLAQVEPVARQSPVMSEAAVTFAMSVLTINRERMLSNSA